MGRSRNVQGVESSWCRKNFGIFLWLEERLMRLEISGKKVKYCDIFTWCTLHISKQGDNIQPWHTLLPILNQSVVPCNVLCCFLTFIHVSQETVKMVWYSHFFKKFPSLLWSTHSKTLKSQWSRSRFFSWNSLQGRFDFTLQDIFFYLNDHTIMVVRVIKTLLCTIVLCILEKCWAGWSTS